MSKSVEYFLCVLFFSCFAMFAFSAELNIFDFTQQQGSNNWLPINDAIMGGVSKSKFETINGVANFSGNVSLEYGGGFASVRSQTSNYDLSAYKGVILRVKGDGKVYDLNLKLSEGFDGIYYKQRFSCKKDEWTSVKLPFDKFVPTFRGKVLTDVMPLDTKIIKSFGLMISDSQAGPFSLQIANLKAYK